MPHTTVCTHYASLRRSTATTNVFLQHGGDNCCRQNDFIVTPCIYALTFRFSSEIPNFRNAFVMWHLFSAEAKDSQAPAECKS